jgi:flagellar hook-associated protein 1 FlgK
MHSSFFGIEIAKKALFAQQRAQENISHNVANANTPGYSRQRVVLESTYMSPNTSMPGIGQLGTGVKVSDVVRIRDSFADMQFRHEYSSLGKWELQSDILGQVEMIFNEPSDIGVSSVLAQFWRSLEELSKTPGSIEVREMVKERAVTLSNTINHAAIQLSQTIDDINFRISVKVDEVNTLAGQIAELNGQIQRMEITGVTASDLRDKRDNLLDDLSKLVNFNSYEDENGQFSINVGGALLVKGIYHDGFMFDKNDSPAVINWESYGTPANISGGELKGMMDLRDNKVQVYLDRLAVFASTFAQKFNEVHRNGFDLNGSQGDDFFKDPQNLAPYELIAVDQNILNDIDRIAAAGNKNGVPGDNTNALELAAVKSRYYEDISGTFNDFYGSLISRIGIDSQEAGRMADSQEFIVSQLDQRRKEVSGVSLDEEMAKMIMHQHAYSAAARVITAVDQMIDTVVNKMGIVGR